MHKKKLLIEQKIVDFFNFILNFYNFFLTSSLFITQYRFIFLENDIFLLKKFKKINIKKL